MIVVARGSLLDVDVEALVNPVNCVGVIGKGLALQFRRAFPDVFRAFERACRAGEVEPGRLHIVKTRRATAPCLVINFPTKRHWRDDWRMEDIETGLAALVAEVHRRGILSIAIPALGCGLGGLNWAEVRQRIEEGFGHLVGVQVLLFEPR